MVPAGRAEPETPWWKWSAQDQAVLETGLIVAGLLVLFFFMPHQLRGDDLTRLNDIDQLLAHGRLTNSRFSLLMPLASAPFLLLSNLAEKRAYWADHFNTIALAIGVAVAYRMLRGRVDAHLFRLVVLVLLCASFLTNRLRDYNDETFTAVLVTLGIICLVTNRRVVLGWALIVLGAVNTPAAIVGLGLLAVLVTVRTRRLRHLIPIAAGLALIMLEAWIRRGSPFSTGYEGQAYDTPFLLGLASILFSFGRGLLFFTPGLALWLNGTARRQLPWRAAVALMMAFVAGLILIYSKWWAWYGGLSWGPRFFTFAAIPASIMIASGIWRAGRSAKADALTLGVLALSAWVSIAGALANLNTVLTYCGQTWTKEYCLFRPQNSALWQPLTHFPAVTAETGIVLVFICGVFVYLAAPLVVSIARSMWPRREWAADWRV
jgi:hypothetical protein